MAAWDEGDYQGALDGLNILKAYVRQCDSDTPRQSLKVKEHIDYLLDHSDQEPDDMKRDKNYQKKMLPSYLQNLVHAKRSNIRIGRV